MVLLTLGVAAYTVAALNRLHDSTSLAIEVSELQEFQEILAGLALAIELDPEYGSPERIVDDVVAHLDHLRPSLTATFGEEEAARITAQVSSRFRLLATMVGPIARGDLEITGLVAPYIALSSEIEGVLAELSTESIRATTELRRAFLLGLAALVFGGTFSAGGFGWASRRAHRLDEDVRQAKEFDRLKSEFVAVASHELRTPLTSIYGFSRLLADTDELSDEDRKKWATHIHTEAERLTGIVDELLNISRIESGTVEFLDETIAIQHTVHQVVDAAAVASDNHTIVTCGDLDAVVRGDPNRLIEVLNNLVDNAIKYSPDGGTITIRGQRDGRMRHVTVQDQGVGIPQSELATIFDRFKRVSNPKTENVRSTGLGLYFVQHFVRAMGGDVQVSSEMGAGSTFTFSIPLETEERPIAEAVAA